MDPEVVPDAKPVEQPLGGKSDSYESRVVPDVTPVDQPLEAADALLM